MRSTRRTFACTFRRAVRSARPGSRSMLASRLNASRPSDDSARVVRGVLVDVTAGQIAAECRRRSVAESERDLEIDDLGGERRANGRFVEVDALAAAHD